MSCMSCCAADHAEEVLVNPVSEANGSLPRPVLQEETVPAAQQSSVRDEVPKIKKPGKPCTTRMPKQGDFVMCMGGMKVGHDNAGNAKKWILNPGNAAEVMEIDEDGDFRLSNEQGIESGFLFREEFVYIADTENEEAAPVPAQKMRASLVDKNAIGPVLIEDEGKAETKSVPAAPAAPVAPLTPTAEKFEVTLQKKDPTDKCGLQLDCNNEKTFEVVKVTEGLVKSYNDTVAESKKIVPGHCVVGINGKSGMEMLSELSTSKELKLMIAPTINFTVQLTKSGTQQLGMNLAYEEGCSSLLLNGFAAGGLLDTYNKSAPQTQRVGVGDRIIEVNGVSGEPLKILDALKTSTALSLKVARPVC